MNNINIILANLSFRFDNPLYLLILIPGIALAFWPYFRIRKDKRRTRERIVSMILHLVILLLASFVLAGFTIHQDQNLKQDETFLLVDVSDSNYSNSDALAKYINAVIEKADVNNKVGIIVYGCGEPRVYKTLQSRPKVSVNDLWDYFDNPKVDKEGFVMTEGTDIAKALNFAVSQFSDTEESDDYEGKKIIIFSDGLETDGNAESVAKGLSQKNLVIDAVYFAPKEYDGENEMQISNVEIENNSPKPAQPIEIKTTIQSHTYGNGAKATIKIYDLAESADTAIATEEFDVTSQEETFPMTVAFTKGGVHTVKVVMESSVEDEESVKQNNIFYSYVVVQTKSNSILIIDGSGTGCSDLVNLLDEKVVGENGYEVVVKNHYEAPSDISKYGEVILVDVNSSGSIAKTGSATDAALPRGYDTLLNNYVANGGGVLTIGGSSTYYKGGMNTDKFSDFLPVSVKPEPSQSKAIILAIDYSSGMYDSGGITLIKKALVDCLYGQVFNENDYIGIIFFGGNKNTPIVALNLTNAYNIVDIEAALNKTPLDFGASKNYLGNTDWRHALEKSASLLNAFNSAQNKHTIFITDGVSNDTGYPEGESSKLTGYPIGGWKYYGPTIASGTLGGKCYTGYMYDKYGITTSTIDVLNTFPRVSGYIQQMATDGEGHYYHATTTAAIYDAVDEECKNIPTKLVNVDKEYIMSLSDVVSATTGIKDDQLPVLQGFNGVTVKEELGAYSLIDTDTDPIYAEWTYGKGKVGSLMTAITPQTVNGETKDWSNGLINDAEGKVLFKYLIDSCFKSSVSGLSSDMTIDFEQKNFTTTITAKDITNAKLIPTDGTTSPGGMESYYHSPSDNIDPSKNSSLDYLCPVSAEDYEWDTMNLTDSSFTSSFQMMEAGLYTVAFNRMDSNGYSIDTSVPYTYVTFSYSNEYNTFYSASDARKKLEDICSNTNGEVIYNIVVDESGEVQLTDDTNIFSTDRQYSSKDINPVVGLMIAALLLFILDVAARKFHFLWPAELIRKMRGENVAEAK